MPDLLQDLVAYLTAEGVVLTNPYYVDYVPDQPDLAISLMEHRAKFTQLGSESSPRSVQIRSRAETYAVARENALKVYAALTTNGGGEFGEEYTLPNTRWALIFKEDDPHSMGRDSDGRAQFNANIVVVTTQDY